MGIEQQMSFDFSRGQKLKKAIEYNIVPTEENLEKIYEKDGVWYFGVTTLDQFREIYSDSGPKKDVDY